MRALIAALLFALASVVVAGDPPTPPLPNPHDGCTLAPDLNFRHCCDVHDEAYWRGGTEEDRERADRAFRQCIHDAGHPILDQVYYIGVRIGGVPWLPTHWRWGFGWPYSKGHRGYAPQHDAK